MDEIENKEKYSMKYHIFRVQLKLEISCEISLDTKKFFYQAFYIFAQFLFKKSKFIPSY